MAWEDYLELYINYIDYSSNKYIGNLAMLLEIGKEGDKTTEDDQQTTD